MWNFFFKKKYQQIAITFEICTTIENKSLAFEYFTAFGFLTILPSLGRSSSVILCVPKDKEKEVLSWRDEYFIYFLQKELKWNLGKIIRIENRKQYSLNLIRSKKHVSHRLALIGNAAQTLHPIAGKGLNLGIRDAKTLADILSFAIRNSKNVGDYSILSKYQRKRKSDQMLTIKTTDRLNRLFSNNFLPVKIARNLAMLSIANLPSLRKELIWKIIRSI